MKRFANRVLGLGVAGMLVTGSAVAGINFSGFSPIIGLDYYQAWMNGQNTINAGGTQINGSSAFAKSYPGATAYIGAKFNDNFGVELGYDWSTNKSHTTSTSTITLSEKVRRSAGHLDLVGYLPMNDCSSLFLSFGGAIAKAKITNLSYTTAGVSHVLDVSSKAKTLLRAGLGVNYMFTSVFGARAKVGWEGTSYLRNNIDKGGDKKYFRDSGTFALGAFAQF